jgi:hypothetical protein
MRQHLINSKPGGVWYFPKHAAAAEQNFPAVVPMLSTTLLESMALGVSLVGERLQQCDAAAALHEDAAATNRSGSWASVQQCRASAALLVVLLARSLVVLADAMEAAAAAAGMTPAQLLARCGHKLT